MWRGKTVFGLKQRHFITTSVLLSTFGIFNWYWVIDILYLFFKLFNRIMGIHVIYTYL